MMKSLHQTFFRTCAAFASSTRAHCVHRAGVSPSTRSTRLFATDFQAASPPGTHGTPVFPDIDFSRESEESVRRNNDAEAVFVVTGANRGIGLQFVKVLTTKTQARASD